MKKKIQVLLQPNTDLLRTDAVTGEHYFVFFEPVDVKELAKKYKGKLKTWITRKEKPGIKKGSWVCISDEPVSFELFKK